MLTRIVHKTALKKNLVSGDSFTGKERDAETGFSYFGARYYDSDLSGLFLSVDPMADKYPGISPYAYCAWNPLKLVDDDGEEPRLNFHGQKSMISFVNIVNSGLGNQFQASLTKNSDGSYSFGLKPAKGGGDVSQLNMRQKAFYEELMTCIDAKGKGNRELEYYIDVYYGSKDVLIGNYKNNAIDVADMEQFNIMGDGGVTAQGKLVHEMVEQYRKAYHGNEKGDNMGYDFCHKAGCISEGKVYGLRRDLNGDSKSKRNEFIERHIDNKGNTYSIRIIDMPIIQVIQ